MGFSGNSEPMFVIPSCISSGGSSSSSNISVNAKLKKSGIEDLDFSIGDEALESQKNSSVAWPIRHGQVENWDLMERYWQQCIFKYLRCEPEDHPFLLVKRRIMPD
jgi:actin-related protein 3